MVSLEEALIRINERLAVLPAERSPLPAALGRVLAAELRAEDAFPPFARSRRDGYAFRAADAAAADGRPVKFRVTETATAGRPVMTPVTVGTAVRILTGAPVPAGADCVAADEAVERRGDTVFLSGPAPIGQYIEPAGREYRPGDVLLPAGTILSPGALGLAAAAGFSAVPVVRRPVVAILATGDELVKADGMMRDGQIRDSNSILAAALVVRWGGRPLVSVPSPDDPAVIAERLQASLAAADMAVTTGGTGEGDRDCLPAALIRLGAKILFRRLAIRPGTGTLAAILGGKMICALSGSPGAIAVAAELLVRPVLDRFTGRLQTERLMIPARLEESWRIASDLPHYRPVRLRPVGGEYKAAQGRTGLIGLARMNGLAVAADGPCTYAAGETVRVMLTREVDG
ncbi:MAG: molybdopterin molybdotransferase MoeA [bacterium]|jgi:molybdopterin molybdotransferase